jgi:hypothetical protein
MILVPGTLVKHPGQPSWGPGEILPGGVAGKVRVRFAGAGEKTLSLAHALLEVIGRAEAERLRVELRDAPAPPIPGPDPENPDAEKAFQLLQGREPCVFVTGRAGTGKSYLLRYFARKTKKRFVLLAPTGLAALNVGGQTIHSFFMFPWGLLNRGDVKQVWDSNKRQLIRKVDTFVIDEVSMVNANLMDAIDEFLRLNGRDARKPFGGAQVVLFGDPYQLPPVLSREDEAKFMEYHYRSPFFWDAKVFEQLPITVVELRKNYRQKELEFIDVLNGIRLGELAEEHQALLNARCDPGFETDPGEIRPWLTTTNARAAQINAARLARLPGPEHVFAATFSGKAFDGENLPAEAELKLRPGAQVLFVKNDAQDRWVNGTFGRVVTLAKDVVEVEVALNGFAHTYRVEPETWESRKYTFDPKTEKITSEVVGKFTQYPLRPAWAITIHKSQGQTLERIVVDLGRGAFEHGQVYVALSRCPTLEGITLATEIWPNDVLKVSGHVREFMDSVAKAAVLPGSEGRILAGGRTMTEGRI